MTGPATRTHLEQTQDMRRSQTRSDLADKKYAHHPDETVVAVSNLQAIQRSRYDVMWKSPQHAEGDLGRIVNYACTRDNARDNSWVSNPWFPSHRNPCLANSQDEPRTCSHCNDPNDRIDAIWTCST